jgi:hypothetical protein
MTDHIKQNVKDCLPIIQSSGCRFRCDGLAAEYKTGKSLTADQLNETWKWAQDTNRIGKDQPIVCGIKRNDAFNPKCPKCAHWNDCKFNCELDGASIATRFLRLLGDSGSFSEVGTIDKTGTIRWYPNTAENNRRMDAVIQKIHQGGPQGTHFRFVDEKYKLIEDPHSPPLTVVPTKELPTGIYYMVIYSYIS